MRVNKGRAGYVYRGEYDSATAYDKLDTVYDTNTTYQCTAPCTGKKPSENPDYWAPMCASATAVDRAAAEAAAQAAEQSKSSANGYAIAAGASADAAEIQRQEAASAAEAAAGSATSAGSSSTAAANSAADAANAKTAAETARDQAQQTAGSMPTMQAIMLALRPVGSIYESLESTDPDTLFGGTWEALPPGVFLVSAGDGYAAGATGGNKQITLTQGQLPAVPRLPLGALSVATSGGGPIADYGLLGWTQGTSTYTNQTAMGGNLGSGDPVDITPPYLAVYRWKRTA